MSTILALVWLGIHICTAGALVTERYRRQPSSVDMTATRRLNSSLIEYAVRHARSCSRNKQGISLCAGFQFKKPSCVLYSRNQEPKYYKHRKDSNKSEMYLSSTFVESESHGESTDKFAEGYSISDQCDYKKGYCLEGTCACVFGFRYNFTIRQCVERCSVYGDTFSRYKSSAIDGCNVVHNVLREGMSCTQLCLTNIDITCVSTEFNNISKACNLCDRT